MDFRGKRVGQIGTGSTGIQSAPVIAETAEHLTVFQRTAQYSVPARNAPLEEAFMRDVREHHDAIREVVRSTPNGHPFRIDRRKAFDVSEAERQAIYEAAWEKGGLQFRASFRDLVLDKAANDTAAEFIKRKIREIVKDPKTAQASPISTIPMRRSARRSTRTISRPSIATTSRWSTCAPSRSSASRRPASRRARANTRWTSSSSPPASTR